MHAAVQLAPVVFVSATHVVPHRWVLAGHAGTQDVPLHVTVPPVGAVQVAHEGPQAAMVSLATQVGWPAVPRRQKPGVLHTTRQLNVPGMATLSQAAMPFAGGAGHAVQDVPHELRLVLEVHSPVVAGQRWNPALQDVPHALVTHTASALGSVGAAQVAHDVAVPHAMVLSSAKQPLVAGHMCVPAPQTTPQAPFTQPWPLGHGVQSTPSIVPQVSDELLLTQMPLQRCQPLLQSGTHVPVVPVHVTVPLSGAEQAVQVLPHELTLVLLLAVQVAAAPVPHWWKLLLQSTPQVVPLQTGLPFGGSTHAVQPVAVQPDAVLLFATHDVGAAVGQPWKPVAQVTLQVVPLHAAVPLVGAAQAVQPVAEHPEATLLLATQFAFAPVPHR